MKTRLAVLALLASAAALTSGSAVAQAPSTLTYAMHVTLAPVWFDPADNTGIATPFMVQEAVHDALVKPMPGNPTRIENYYVTGGLYSPGGHPDIDDLFQQQARELDRKKREALLHKIQQLANDRVLYLPVYALYFNNGVGPRVAEPSLNRIPLHYYTSPFEDLKLKGQ